MVGGGGGGPGGGPAVVPSSADVRDLREALRWHSERIDELHGMCTLVASGMCTLVASAQ